MDEDFGFTFETKNDIVEDNRLEQVLSLVLPFLNNLKKSPELDTIRWPNRVEEINKFIKKLEKIKDNNV